MTHPHIFKVNFLYEDAPRSAHFFYILGYPLVDFFPFVEQILQHLFKLVNYILSADRTHGYVGHLADTLDDIFNDIGGAVGIDYPVEERCINIDAYIIFGVDDLVSHVDYFGF